VFGSILHRMILWEVFKVFAMALIGITGILLMAGIIAEASNQGLPPGQILAAIPLLIPSTLPYTIPATTLFATCVCYGRLAADNEILAIKSAGVNIGRVVLPGLILGVTMSAVTMGLYYRIIPYTHHLLRAMVFKDAEKLIYNVLAKQHCIVTPNIPYAMWVQDVQYPKLINPTFKHRDSSGNFDVVVSAKEAELRVNMAKKIMQVRMRYGVASGEDGSHAYFVERFWDVPLPDDLFGNDSQRRPRDLTWQEILERRRKLRKEMEQDLKEAGDRAAEVMLQDAPPPDMLMQHIKNLRERAKATQGMITQLDVELLMRPALSVGCFFFILVGCPIGIWFSKSDYLSSFITCFLPIVFVYYPLTLCGTGFAKDGKFNPIVLVWGPNVLMAVVGLFLFWRLSKN
jgi:lipopolysaccharide export system permease protein